MISFVRFDSCRRRRRGGRVAVSPATPISSIRLRAAGHSAARSPRRDRRARHRCCCSRRRRPPPPAPDAEALFREGLKAYDAKQYARAIESFEAAHRLSPLPEILFDIAMARRALGDCPRAAEGFDAFIAAAPADDPLLARARARRAELDACANGDGGRWRGGAGGRCGALHRRCRRPTRPVRPNPGPPDRVGPGAVATPPNVRGFATPATRRSAAPPCSASAAWLSGGRPAPRSRTRRPPTSGTPRRARRRTGTDVRSGRVDAAHLGGCHDGDRHRVVSSRCGDAQGGPPGTMPYLTIR